MSRSFVLILITLAVFACSCESSQQTQLKKPDIGPQKTIVDEQEPRSYLRKVDDHESSSYSDSMIQELIKSSKNQSESILDTQQIIHNLFFDSLKTIQNYRFDLDTINKYNSGLKTLEPDLQRLFKSDFLFGRLDSLTGFQFLITYQQDYESHYSANINLITINMTSLEMHKLILAEEYRSEQIHKTVESYITTGPDIEQKTKIQMSYLHGVGKTDSIQVIKTKIYLDPQKRIVIDTVL